MKKTTQNLILCLFLSTLFACSEPTVTAAKQEPTAVPPLTEKPTTKTSKLDLSVPDELTADQTTHLEAEQALLPELFNQEQASSKYKVTGNVLLDDEQSLGAEALDGAEVRITINK